MDAALFLLFIIALAIYFLPSIVGWNKRNADSIIALNFFLGWTFVGWVIALVWGLSNDAPSRIRTVRQNDQGDKFDQIKKLKSLLDSGAITENEYQIEKSKILDSFENIIKPGTEINFKP